jgi:phosphonoacetate hydrolase
MSRKVLLMCIDGCEPAYIERSDTPTLDRIARSGFHVEGASVIPSVTNVNNTSILTGAFPCDHGITSNYWYDRVTKMGDYVESAEFVRIPTVLERAATRGLSTIMLTSKGKLLRLLGRGAGTVYAAESPPEFLVDRLGPPGDIYSAEINVWLFRAARELLRSEDPDVMYVSTTDFVQHKYAPEHEVAQQQMHDLDHVLGDIIDDRPEREVYVTADHGMRAKTAGVDLRRVIGAPDGDVTFLPIIKDKYVAHHDNLAGAAFLFCTDDAARERTAARLAECPEVERIYTNAEAAAAFSMPVDRIGDYFVLGTPDVVFGEFESERQDVTVRSHGSHHEARVPIYGWNACQEADRYRYNIDIVRNLGI